MGGMKNFFFRRFENFFIEFSACQVKERGICAFRLNSCAEDVKKNPVREANSGEERSSFFRRTSFCCGRTML
jgi:hypothetical protein